MMNTIETLGHLLVPRHSNNYKAKLLHSLSLLTIAAFLMFAHSLTGFLSIPQVRVLGYASNIPPAKVVEETNQKRVENGLTSLTYSDVLSEAAKEKASDMFAKDYWAHVAPDGTQPWDFFKNVGYSYRYAGENLARDFSDTDSAIAAWMASPSHRENMLSGKYTEIGVAVMDGSLNGKDTTLIVQLFGTPSTAVAAVTGNSAATTTPEPSQVVSVAKAQEVAQPELQQSSQQNAPAVLASQFDVMRTITLVVVGAFFVILLVDLIVTSRKGVTRVGGRTLAHLSFMVMVFIILLLAKVGEII